MRLRGDDGSREFAEWLLDVGHGRNSDDSGDVQLPPSMRSDGVNSLIDFIYPDVASTPPPPPEYFAKRMILAPRNSEVDNINQEILDRMSGEEQVFTSADSVLEPTGEVNSQASIPSEFLRSLQESGLPPGELHVKVGCPLILLRNLAPGEGLCNGTRMILLRASARVLQVRIIGGSHDGNIAFIPRITITPSASQANFSFSMRRRQFPVRLAFAMSINKAQGQSVDWVGIDLRNPVFTHGQLYVALSRAMSAQRIRVLLPDDNKDSKVHNIVFDEVLLD